MPYLLKTLLPALLTFTQISDHHISVSTFLCKSYCLKYSFYGMFFHYIHSALQDAVTADKRFYQPITATKEPA